MKIGGKHYFSLSPSPLFLYPALVAISPSMPISEPAPPNEPVRLHTHGAQRDHFEKYTAGYEAELADEDYEAVREEIALHYGVPAEHRHIISDDLIDKKRRTQRAFSVVILDNGEKYYIDGRTPHAILLRTLKKMFHVPFDPDDVDAYSSVHGFIDPDGFADIEMVQNKAKELGRSVTWFVRYTVPSSSPSSSPLPASPIEMS